MVCGTIQAEGLERNDRQYTERKSVNSYNSC
jgi:hypothetical protein